MSATEGERPNSLWLSAILCVLCVELFLALAFPELVLKEYHLVLDFGFRLDTEACAEYIRVLILLY